MPVPSGPGTNVAERNEKHLRAVKSGGARKKKQERGDVDIDALAKHVLALDAKLQEQEGIAGLSANVEKLRSAVGDIPAATLDETRAQIRELIDRLLKINNELQNLLQLKKQLTHD